MPARPLSPLLAALALAACGGGAVGPDYESPLVTLHGRITGSTLPTAEAEVRVAVLWINIDFSNWLPVSDGGPPKDPFAVDLSLATQDIPVRLHFPASFEFSLTRPPPREALLQFPPEFHFPARIASGALIAYDDRDHDGRLGLLTPDGPPSPDRVLGTAGEYGLQWVEKDGDMPLPDGASLGFHLSRAKYVMTPVPPSCDAPDPPPGGGSSGMELPLDTELELSLEPRPTLPPQLCSLFHWDPSIRCTPAPGATVECNAEGTGYRTQALMWTGTSCEQLVTCSYNHCPSLERLPECGG